MTSYDGGCFCCGGHKGAFASLLPNGVCLDVTLAGTHFCNDCSDKIEESPILLKKMIDKHRNPWDEAKEPNCGIPFHLGSYKVEVFVTTVSGKSKRLVIEDEGHCIGLYPDELIDSLQVDVENLRHTARRCVADAVAKKEREG